MTRGGNGLFGRVLRYKGLIAPLTLSTIAASGLSLLIPRLIGGAIDDYRADAFDRPGFMWTMLAVIGGIAVIAAGQALLATFTSETVARDLRTDLTVAVAGQSFSYVSTVTPSKLLTNFTSDVDAVKAIISQGLITVVSAVVTLAGALTLMLTISVRLTVIALCVVPIVAALFGFVIRRVGKLFRQSQENLERINRVVNESVIASALIRVLNAWRFELARFGEVNGRARELGITINRNIAALIPFVQLLSNVITLSILWFGGNLVADSELSIGDFSAFLSYTALLIFPIIQLAFVSNQLTRSFISYGRISLVLEAESESTSGDHVAQLVGAIAFDDVTLRYGETEVIKDVSFAIRPGTRTAIVGPTAAGKTQLFYLLTGLVRPTSGSVTIDGVAVGDYAAEALRGQIGLVFQDSIVFNASLRENIDLGQELPTAQRDKAIRAADLDAFIRTLPDGLDTLLSERGSNLSGGQKQRIMLARALALDPPILLLDDFTARIDRTTEQTILRNLRTEYAGATLISITQRLAPVADYDQILLLMQGELLATGTHDQLMATSLDYRNIFDSQRTVDTP